MIKRTSATTRSAKRSRSSPRDANLYQQEGRPWWEALKAKILAAHEEFNKRASTEKKVFPYVYPDSVELVGGGARVKVNFGEAERVLVRESSSGGVDNVPTQFPIARAPQGALAVGVYGLPVQVIPDEEAVEFLVGEFFAEVLA